MAQKNNLFIIGVKPSKHTHPPHTSVAFPQLLRSQRGTRWCRWLRHCATSCKAEFVIGIIHLAALWYWSWLSLWQKWVPEIIPGGKSGRCIELTNHIHVPIVLKSGSLKVLELSGPVQACNGNILHLPNTAVVNWFSYYSFLEWVPYLILS
jgi:hypothetical protein